VRERLEFRMSPQDGYCPHIHLFQGLNIRMQRQVGWGVHAMELGWIVVSTPHRYTGLDGKCSHWLPSEISAVLLEQNEVG
jgi:hypothetical protein